ncbi:MAG: sulfite exporter TauE/SafE family protein [Candidatus Tectimicrobiota bacterium]
MNPLDIVVLISAALFSALLGSVAGTGGTVVLLPVLVHYFGIQAAVPIITLANFSANVSRVWLHWREIDRRVAVWFTLGSLPLTVLGTWLFTIASPKLLTRLLGAFLLGIVLWRRLRSVPPKKREAIWFLPLGLVFGFINGLVPTVGPLMAPFFLAYGLLKGSYIGTDALITVGMQGTKLAVFGGAHFLTGPVLLYGACLVPFMFAGAFLGRVVLDRLPAWVFALTIEITLILAGLDFLLRG